MSEMIEFLYTIFQASSLVPQGITWSLLLILYYLYSTLNIFQPDFLDGYYPGFDWFASTIFLMMAGNGDKAWDFLFKFSSVVSSAYLWTPRLHSSVRQCSSFKNHCPQIVTMLRRSNEN